ncbi:MAG: hypothetical protein VCD00_02015 [Candidatus Hydrogenedentota bacterium]
MMLLTAGVTYGHDSPNDVIDALTHRIEEEAKARLLVDRGLEYRVVGDHLRAEQDLRAALELSPEYVPAYIALAQMFVHREQIHEAFNVIESGLNRTSDVDFCNEFYRLRAESHAIEGDWNSARISVSKISVAGRQDLGCVLLWSRIQNELGEIDARVDDLRKAYSDNSAVVLESELIDALRDAEKFEEALERINSHLGRGRYKAEWLLRRAETYRAMGEYANQHADAEAALEELERRLDRARPNRQLYVERAKARVLLGDSKDSRLALDAK